MDNKYQIYNALMYIYHAYNIYVMLYMCVVLFTWYFLLFFVAQELSRSSRMLGSTAESCPLTLKARALQGPVR